MQSNGVYEKKSSLPMGGQDILTDCGIKALSKLENCKTGEMPRTDKSND